MGKKTKSDGKKQARLAKERKREEVMKRCKAWNELADCGSSVLAPALLAFEGCSISFAASEAVGAEAKGELFDLLSENMRAMYEASDWGWDEKEKRADLDSSRARFAIARHGATGGVAGFVHFRFEADDDDEPCRATLYVREIQVSSTLRSKGLGRRLMSLLHLIASKLEIDCVMLTVFKANARARAFYTDKLKYVVDADDPSKFGDDGQCYVILSKDIPKRPALAAANA